jgi:toxin secretion/phage lysis holin
LKEFSLNVLIATVGTITSAYLGGWDAALKMLVALMIIDYVTGVLAAWRAKKLDSDVMFWGGIRKGAVLLVILIAVMLDTIIGDGSPVFRTLAMYFYIGREGLSVTENLGIMGVPLPPAVTKALAQIKQRGEEDKKPRTSNRTKNNKQEE